MFREARKYLSVGLLCATSLTGIAAEPLRIDGTTEETANERFRSMVEQATPEKRMALQGAMLLIVMDGVGSAAEMLARPELRSPSIALVRERVDGMTAEELIALSKTSTTKLAPAQR